MTMLIVMANKDNDSCQLLKQMDRLHQVFSMTKYLAFSDTCIMLSLHFATARQKTCFKNSNMAEESPIPL